MNNTIPYPEITEEDTIAFLRHPLLEIEMKPSYLFDGEKRITKNLFLIVSGVYPADIGPEFIKAPVILELNNSYTYFGTLIDVGDTTPIIEKDENNRFFVLDLIKQQDHRELVWYIKKENIEVIRAVEDCEVFVRLKRNLF